MRIRWEYINLVCGIERERETMLYFCLANILRIVNTMFKKHREKTRTFKSGASETQLDFMLIRVTDS